MSALTKIDRSFTTGAPDQATQVRFCTRCGEPAESPGRLNSAPATRVCALCGMGVVLNCLRSALPGAGAAFVVVTADMQVSAVSDAGEQMFGAERSLLGTNVLELMASPMGVDELGRTIKRAALRSREPVVMPVQGISDSVRAEGMLAARISTCGSPRAALVTVEPSGFGRA